MNREWTAEERAAQANRTREAWTPERRAAQAERMSSLKTGVPLSVEHRAKISDALRGRERPDVADRLRGRKRPEVMAHLRGRARLDVRVDEPGYRAMHNRLAMHLKDEPCAHCGTTTGHLDSALRHDAPIENLRGGTLKFSGVVFSVRESDYMKLCRSCHRRYDIAWRKKVVKTR